MTEQSSSKTDIFLEETRRKFDSQIEQLYALHTKSGIMLGIAGVILTLLVTTPLGEQDSAVSPLLVKFALVPIFISFVLSFISITVRTYNRPPILERLRSEDICKDTKAMKNFIIDALADGIDKNEKLIGRRIRLIRCSYLVLGIGVGMLVVWLSVILFQ